MPRHVSRAFKNGILPSPFPIDLRYARFTIKLCCCRCGLGRCQSCSQWVNFVDAAAKPDSFLFGEGSSDTLSSYSADRKKKLAHRGPGHCYYRDNSPSFGHRATIIDVCRSIAKRSWPQLRSAKGRMPEMRPCCNGSLLQRNGRHVEVDYPTYTKSPSRTDRQSR